VISATAVDELGDATTDKITVEVVDEAASVSIISPPKNWTYSAGTAVTLTGNTFDPDIVGKVPDNKAAWVVWRDGVEVYKAVGHEATLPAGKVLAGNYLVKFSADGDTASRTFKVVAPPAGGTPPTATITKPAQAVTLQSVNAAPVKLTLAGSGTDKEDGSIPGTRYHWTASSEFGTKVLCTGSAVPGKGNNNEKLQTIKDCSTFTAELTLEGAENPETVWSISLQVYDGAGTPGEDTVTVNVVFATY